MIRRDFKKIHEKVIQLLGIEESISQISDEELASIMGERLEILVNELESYKQQLEASAILLESHVEELGKAYEELAAIFEIFQFAPQPDVDPRSLIPKLLEIANNSIEAEVVGFVEKDCQFKFFSNSNVINEDLIKFLQRYIHGVPGVLIKENVEIGSTHINSLMIIPVTGSKGFQGTIVFINKKHSPIFTSSDRKLAEALAQRIATLYDTKAYVEELLAQERLLEEMRIAKRIQHTLIPKSLPRLKYARIAHIFETARIVGGDFFDVWSSPKETLFFAVADVSGKGVPAAIMMSFFKGALRSKLSDEIKLNDLIRFLNNIALENMPSEMFVTFLSAFLTSSGRLMVGNAGHNPLLIVQRNHVEYIPASAPPLRVLENITLEEFELELSSGDLIVSFTDGITEARNERKEEYGLDRLEYIVRKNFDLEETEIVKKIESDLKSFIGNAPQHDDATLLLVRYVRR
ncbi:MAG: phosphoserine phosphatase RsbU/P [Thermotogota bacterium]|nr:phosphoserine phosphatase RsbU/P [Thermotogota bacterium]